MFHKFNSRPTNMHCKQSEGRSNHHVIIEEVSPNRRRSVLCQGHSSTGFLLCLKEPPKIMN